MLSFKACPCQNTYFIFIRKKIQQFCGKTMHLKRVYSLLFNSYCTYSKTFLSLRNEVKKKKTLQSSVILHLVFFSGFRIQHSNNHQKNFPKFFQVGVLKSFMLCDLLSPEKLSWLALCWRFYWWFAYIEIQFNSFSMVFLKS